MKCSKNIYKVYFTAGTFLIYLRKPFIFLCLILLKTQIILNWGNYLGDQVPDVGQDSAGCQVHLPVCWLDQLLVQTQVLHRTLSSYTQLIQIADRQTHTKTHSESFYIQCSNLI